MNEEKQKLLLILQKIIDLWRIKLDIKAVDVKKLKDKTGTNGD